MNIMPLKNFDWNEIIRLEPILEKVLEEARSYDAGEDRDKWLGDKLFGLVGWTAENRDPMLDSYASFNFVFQKISQMCDHEVIA